jgi:hypothetical protein
MNGPEAGTGIMNVGITFLFYDLYYLIANLQQ